MCKACGYVPGKTPVLFAPVFFINDGALGVHDGVKDTGDDPAKTYALLPPSDKLVIAAEFMAAASQILTAMTADVVRGEGELSHN